MEARVRVRVVNRSGLHARPCHALVSTALRFESELRVACAGREVNGKSILELMTLEACQDAELDLLASGRDAPELLASIEALVRSGFSEGPG